MMPRRLVVKLKLPRESHADSTKNLNPRRATKARTPRIPVNIGRVSSSDNHKALMDSEAISVGPDSEKVIVGLADEYSGNLKRKFEETDEEINPSKRGDQKTDSGVVVSEGELIRESEIKINDDDIKNLQQQVVSSVSVEEKGEIRELDQINNIDEISSRARDGCTDHDHDVQAADIKINENDALMAPKTPKRYACSLCSKSFSSHQALGGHKSSHYKFTMKIYDAIHHDDLRVPNNKQLLMISTATTTTTCSHQQNIGHDDRSTRYTCKICFKEFPSGQALGGHQRRHWNGNMKTQSARKILDFDLNELPKEELDHEDFCAN